MSDDLDSIVKGAPLAGHDTAPQHAVGTGAIAAAAAAKPGDPLSHTPSSPSMIYLNLLVLEASLRAQYLELRARRRHHTFFLALLSLWTVGFGYALFLAPREDGRGVGGSVYWVVEVAEKVCFMGGLITAVLVWGTGIWERGVRWPRRWFGVSNRGLRGFNCKLVVMKRPWWAEALATAGWFLTYGLFANSGGSSYRYVDPAVLRDVDRELGLAAAGHSALPMVGEDEERGGHEEDLAPAGDYVKLLLAAKPFSPTFRENWELYRTEYWERENERRALIRAKLKERDRLRARQEGGWFWWLPWRRRAAAAAAAAANAASAVPAAAAAVPATASTIAAASAAAAAEKAHAARADGEKQHHHRLGAVGEHKRTRSGSVRRASMSGSSSRSPTPTIEVDEAGGVARKASTASNASDKRRKKRPTVDSRSVTPEIPSPLAKESSFSSVASAAAADAGATLRSSGSGSGSSSKGGPAQRG